MTVHQESKLTALFGLGLPLLIVLVYQMSNICYNLLSNAHLPVYFNEMNIGDAFHESTSNVPRTDVFITSKLASPFHRPEHVEVSGERCIMHKIPLYLKCS